MAVHGERKGGIVVRRAGRASWWLAVLAIVALGLLLRFRQIDQQVLGGDEHHAIRVARDHTLLEAFTHYDRAENSIPLTLWARCLMQTVGLTELRFRLIAIVAGVGLLAAPLWMHRRLGRSTALVALGLVATTPFAVYYSFVMRPYAPAALLLLVALAAWDRWIRHRGPRAPVVFVVSGALSVFFHLLCLFPLAWLVVLTLVAVRRKRVPRRAAARVIAGLFAAGLALLGPGLPALVQVRLLGSTRPRTGTPSLAWDALVSVAGSRESVAVALVVLAALGAARILRRDRLWGAALVGLTPSVVVGMLVTQAFPASPAWARYLFLTWVPLLMLAAQGAALLAWGLASWLRRRPLAALAGLVPAAVSIDVWTAVRLHGETLPQRMVTWIAACIVLAASIHVLVERGARDSVLTDARQIRVRSLPALLALLLAAGTVAWTPLPVLDLGTVDSFRTRRAAIQPFSDRMGRFEAAHVPAFLKQIASAPDTGEVVLLWPYRVETTLWKPLSAIQSVLGRRVVPVEERIPRDGDGDGIRLRNMTDLDRAGDWAALGARYLVLVLDFVERPADPDGTIHVLGMVPLRCEEPGACVAPDVYANLKPVLQRRFGEPVHRDGALAVYDLRVRR